MTTEDDFQAALDAHPDDATCRLVFADWLDERGDPRAEGYRAIGTIGFRPYGHPKNYVGTLRVKRRLQQPFATYSYRSALLPEDWFQAVAAETVIQGLWMTFPTRRAAEDAAALAFAKLPAARRAELLATVPA